jgi:ATPase subunit of ABC transporter with duplicated ATPase domains
MVELSGGWRLRVALALVLIAATKDFGCGDVLLLDEPTNHRECAAALLLLYSPLPIPRTQWTCPR